MIILSIDAGKQGALAYGPPNQTPFCEVTPTLASGDYNLPVMLDLVTEAADIETRHPFGSRHMLAVIEEPVGFVRFGEHRTSAAAMLTMGEGLGLWRMAIVAACRAHRVEPEIRTVKPNVWKARMGLSGRHARGTEEGAMRKAVKGAAIERAQMIFPDVDLRATPKCRTQHDGKADALCLWKWAEGEARQSELRRRAVA